MGQSCTCVKDQMNQPTINLADNGRLGDDLIYNEEQKDWCESEINPREADEAININLGSPDRNEDRQIVRLYYQIFYKNFIHKNIQFGHFVFDILKLSSIFYLNNIV